MFFAAAVPLQAEPFLHNAQVPFTDWLTNSIFVTVMVVLFITWLARRATRQMKLVPDGPQNFFEALVEGLYTLLEGIVGRHMIAKCFSFLATIFIFLVITNWFSLFPGVGSIGWGQAAVGENNLPLSLQYVSEPILRPGSADLNLTLGMAAVAMVLWFVWTMQEVGPVGFLKHLFAPKGGMKGIVGLLMVGIFLFVGVLELISIATRPISLSLRLFGNIYAGENVLGLMINLGRDLGLPTWASAIASVIVPIPFYFLELMVGVLQAFVFMLLCAVYIQLSTSHEEEGSH